MENFKKKFIQWGEMKHSYNLKKWNEMNIATVP